ncbi:hypothetical protein RHOSPDRAFT_36274 [Rhodotorula sp. JG-1b]|nr:hypothetical protein RHOSPDRAFT_36274 [Rhodotorula sp. JG-1b]
MGRTPFDYRSPQICYVNEQQGHRNAGCQPDDTTNKVAKTLSTNPSGHIRKVRRAIHFRFLVECPQSRGRSQVSLAFVAENLSNGHESERLSVLKIVSAILQKLAAPLTKESADPFHLIVVAKQPPDAYLQMALQLAEDSWRWVKTMRDSSADSAQPGDQSAQVKVIKFGIEYKVSCLETLTNMFGQNLTEAMRAMRAVYGQGQPPQPDTLVGGTQAKL